MLPGGSDQKELNEMEEPLGTSPPLELRRTVATQRVAVPHSLQSPQDRTTGNFNLCSFIDRLSLFFQQIS